ncbi:MAG: asparaginase [Candidatus Peribacteraceae bacterium]|nr:asparaginase [Candidatus Peribacteraceae bacterium]
MKVLILFCGGTIIMKENKKGALLTMEKEEAINMLLNMEPKLHEIADLDVHYVDNIDSTNMNPAHWDRIGQAIADKYDDYDGFVITHGTDTMAFTASALSFSLNNLGKPVTITGSQIPGNRLETDARRNFVNAVRVASMGASGVMLIFDEEIILGARSSKVSESKLNAFETMNWDLLGEIRIDIRFSEDIRSRHDQPLNFQPGFEANIAVITLFPGLPASALHGILRSGVKGMVLRGYGSGNIPYDYLEVIQAASKLGVPVVVNTQCLEGATLMHLYDVGRQAMDAGAIQAYDMSLECTVTKLMWALRHSNTFDGIKSVMHTSYVGEINKEGKIY